MKAGELILTPFEQPIEEERRGDPDQADDDSKFEGEKKNLCEFFEPGGYGTRPILGVRPAGRFRYFLDGSVRTKYVGEYVEGDLSLPLLVADISVAVMERVGRSLRPAAYKKHLYFVLPHKDSGLLTDTTYDRLEEMAEELEKQQELTRIAFLKKADVKGDIRYSLLGKVRRLMHDMEHEVAKQLERSNNDWLIMDGAIRKQEFLELPNTIGVAKSFSRKPLFATGGKRITLAAYMKNVKEGERSAMVRKADPDDEVSKNTVFWYVRLRTFPPMEPLGGLVKIDIRTPGHPEDSIQLVDEISSELYQMRSPSVYPWPRWPSYIYPIRVGEVYMTAKYLGDYVLTQVGHAMKESIKA